MTESYYFDVAVLIVYLVVCLCIGLYKAFRIKNIKAFAVGTATLSMPVLVLTILATAVGAGFTIGYSEKIYTYGTIYVFCMLFHPLFWFITAWVFARNIERFSGCLSISEVMYKLYGSPGRWITSIVSIIFSIGIVAAHASAVGYVFHYFFDVNFVWGIFISFGVLTTYSALGGIRAVVLTEIFQFTIFIFIIPVAVAYSLNKVGGIESLMIKLPITEWGLSFSYENLPFALSLIFFILLPNTLAPSVQRYLMASNTEALKKSLKIIALITIPLEISICIIAYIVRIQAPEINPADTFVYFINNFLPIGIKSLMITGIIAIIMSVTESFLNTCSVIMVNDVIKVLYPKVSRIKQLVALRLSVFFISGLSILIAVNEYGILKLIILVQNLWTPLILVPLCIGFLGFKTNSKAFISSIITALIFTFSGRYYAGEFSTISIGLGCIGSALGLFGMHYWQQAFTVSQIRSQPKSYYLQWESFVSIISKVASKKFHSFIKLLKTPLDKPHLPKASYYPFASFVLVYYFIYTLYLNSTPSHTILFYLLVLGYFLCLTLLLKDILFSEAFQRKYLPIYWYFTLTFCLPLVSSYMLFASNGDDFWIINGLLSAFSLYFFANYLIFATSLSIGAVAGFLLFIFSDLSSVIPHSHGAIISTGYVYLFFLFTSLFFMRQKEIGQTEQLEIMQMVGASIAHEVKTPIATMSMCANALSEVLKSTFIKQSEDQKTYSFVLDKNEYELLNNVTNSMQHLSKKGVTTADNILISLRTSVVANDKKLYSLKECVEKALDEYAFHHEATKNIQVRINDKLTAFCSLYYFKHMIFNLLKNAYKYNGNDVKIKIWSQGRHLHFKDYGNGIDEDDLPHIFKKFYTKSETGTGIGLPFCRMVMEDFGGTIECISQPGKFTEFIISFPLPSTI